MRLLFLTPQLPYPPTQGASLRNWGWLRELSARHEVHLFTLRAPEQAAALPLVEAQLASVTALPVPHRPLGQRLAQLVTTATPDLALRLWSHEVLARLEVLLATTPFDVVQVEGLELLPYAAPFLGRRGPAWVYDAHNAEAELQASAWQADLRQPRRWPAAGYSLVQWLKLARYEAAMLPRFDGVVAVSQADAAALAARTIAKRTKGGGVRPLVLPNGVDTSALTPDAVSPHPALVEHPALVFTGKMDFRPNVDAALWFAGEILPRVRAEMPAARFWIVGQQPHTSLARLRGQPGIEITGAVEQIEPYLAGAAVVVVPLRMGSGTRLKVLQALSMARPVVGTRLGCAGLGLHDGVHVRLADRAAEFAAAILRVLAQPESTVAMARAGRAHVVEHFDWRVLAPRLEAFYAEILGWPERARDEA